MGFPQIRGNLLGVSLVRIIFFWAYVLGSLYILENLPNKLKPEGLKPKP